MKKFIWFTMLLITLSSASGLLSKCSKGNCPYSTIDCSQCCRAGRAVSPECCAACNNCCMYNDEACAECKDFPT